MQMTDNLGIDPWDRGELSGPVFTIVRPGNPSGVVWFPLGWLSGGREAGYRAYTFKQQLDPGDWRVDLEAEDGRIIGRVSVTVEIRDESPPQLTTIFY